jgi:hypothetical protein
MFRPTVLIAPAATVGSFSVLHFVNYKPDFIGLTAIPTATLTMCVCFFLCFFFLFFLQLVCQHLYRKDYKLHVVIFSAHLRKLRVLTALYVHVHAYRTYHNVQYIKYVGYTFLQMTISTVQTVRPRVVGLG